MRGLALPGALLAAAAMLLAGATAAQGVEGLRSQARALLAQDDYDGAIALYRRVVEIAPADAVAHYDLAGVLGFVQRNAEAAVPIREAVRLAPEEPRYHAAAAIIFANAGLHREAFQANLRAAELGEVTAMYELVWLYDRGQGVARDRQRAVAWALRAAEHGHIGAMSLLVDVYLNGRFDQPVDLELAEQWALRAHAAQQ